MLALKSLILGLPILVFVPPSLANSLELELGLVQKKYPGPCRTVRTHNKKLDSISHYVYDTNHREMQQLLFDPKKPPAEDNKENGFPENAGLWQYYTSTYYENGRLQYRERHFTDEGMTERNTYRYDGKGRKKKLREEHIRKGKPAFFYFTEWKYHEKGPLEGRLDQVFRYRQDVGWKKPRNERIERYKYEGEFLKEKVTWVYWIDKPDGKREWTNLPQLAYKDVYQYRGGVRSGTLDYRAVKGKFPDTPEFVDEIVSYGAHATREDKRDGLEWSHHQSKSPAANGGLKLNHELRVEYDSAGNTLKQHTNVPKQGPKGDPWESLTVFDYSCWTKKKK